MLPSHGVGATEANAYQRRSYIFSVLTMWTTGQVVPPRRHIRRRTMTWQTAWRTTFTKTLPIFVPYLLALLLFARAIVNSGDFYYCVVLTNVNIITNGVNCIYKILFTLVHSI